MRVGSLCTGYGGIEMGLRLAGVDIDLRWLAENDPVLDPLHGEVTNLGDLRSVDWSWVEPVDLLTAGFPCQPVSAAGRQRAEGDERWLWPDVLRAIDWLTPRQVLIENVRNLISTRKGELWAAILGDLHRLGYRVRWLTLGACHVGAAHHRHRVFALATRDTSPAVEHVQMSFCGAKGGTVLPTPAARDGDGRGEGDEAYWAARAEVRTNGVPLGAAVALLPTPSASDHTGAGHAAQGGLNLRSAAALLPTPCATDGTTGPGAVNNRGEPSITGAVQPQHWGRYAEAVARHEACYGPAPAPTEPNRNGAPRLAPAFAEWLMCLPAGHVTSKLDRIPALRAIGNGVCPPQLAAAWELLS